MNQDFPQACLDCDHEDCPVKQMINEDLPGVVVETENEIEVLRPTGFLVSAEDAEGLAARVSGDRRKNIAPEGGPCLGCPFSRSVDLTKFGDGLRWSCFCPEVIQAVKAIGVDFFAPDDNTPTPLRGVYENRDVALVAFRPDAFKVPHAASWPMAFLPEFMHYCLPRLVRAGQALPADAPSKEVSKGLAELFRQVNEGLPGSDIPQ